MSGGFVFRRLDFCEIHGKVEDYLNRLSFWISIIIAVHIDFHLLTISDDTLPTMLE